ncbi:DUF2318 domain-containing protein [Bifidobacterium sp. SMB2]|uniref:DUF2318 domain-containing protein n=1 Tax=Bifidobacterium saimiriisciurei TaxID=2661627 RepID=A0ABX0CB01_9BIFI|nr:MULTISPECIES: DUF2318 domain-containing protein [Bifidobacterium]NEG95427.1 DUF2318 domain-containing protein [Bifidobacterium sp. SMB2]NEH11389.1 DUF2318 domain-containing protein [Bifidobacterium saimiriisciurei]
MLKQFVTVMPGTLAVALLVMCLSVMLTVGEGKDKPISARWRLWGFSIGFVAAIIFASLRATAVINQRTFVNFPVLVCAIIVDVLTIIVIVMAHHTTKNWHKRPVLLHVSNGVAAVCIALAIFYALPDVILQLTIFVEPGDPVFTSAMLLRALGFLLGVGASVVIAAIFRTMRSTAVRPAFTFAALAVAVILFVQHFTALIQMQQDLLMYMPLSLFTLLVWFINHNTQLIMAQAWVFIVPAIASVIAGFHMPMTGANEAIVRTHKAFRRRAVAASVWSLIAMIGVTVTLTVGVAEINKTPTLSPPESYSLSKGVATIKFSQVADGHLHRFEYKAKDGTTMRFIIIKKNGGAYGVGLDACDNCGDAGYYEKDGKIICKKCDVAINLATIGFKGGCNPVPFPYKAGNGAITIQTSDLDALSAHFKL